ncbi:hypothetical protein [Nonlabens tegetincola]|uniref:hypothetical protein n=1 Tax=Nonlabens tegetincola TaxID=323273 RepID=UPI0011AFD828|nr:hypothetical protein [Nonlabens tegetincola]
MNHKLGIPKLTRHISTQGFRVILLYLFIFYLIPFIGVFFYFDDYAFQFNGIENTYNVVYIPLILLFVVILDNLIEDFKLGNKLLTMVLLNKRLNFALSFIGVALSINFFLNYSINYRHAGEGLAESGFLVIALVALKAYFRVYLVYQLIIFSHGDKFSKSDRWLSFLILLMFLISINASLEVLTIFLCLLLALGISKPLFIETINVINPIKPIFRGVVLGIVVILVVFMGNANKVGTDKAIERFTNKEEINNTVFRTIKRISTYHVSLLNVPTQYHEDNEFVYEGIQGTWDNLKLRVCLVFSNDCGSKPQVWSIFRANFLQITKVIFSDRAGASPGLFASAFYIPFFPLNLFIISFYIVLILRVFSKIFSYSKKKLSWIFFFLLLFLITYVLDSPVDIINILGPQFIFLIFLFSLPNALSLTLDEKC